MGIQIANPVTMPAVTYDKIHMTKLDVTQPILDNDEMTPRYQVVISYRHYGVVNGARLYKNEDVQRISLDDFLTKAQTKAQAGDTSLMNALTSIETAIASIIADQTGVETTVL